MNSHQRRKVRRAKQHQNFEVVLTGLVWGPTPWAETATAKQRFEVLVGEVWRLYGRVLTNSEERS